MAEPQSQIKTIGLSYEGRPLKLEDIPESSMNMPRPSEVTEVDPRRTLNYKPPVPKNYNLDIEEQMTEGGYREVDYQNLVHVNLEIISLMKRMHSVREDMRAAERAVIKTRIAYDQSLRRELIKVSGATEKVRQAFAEIQCEELYKNWQIAVQIMKELQQFSKDVRTELDALKEISNNLRRQIDIESRL